MDPKGHILQTSKHLFAEKGFEATSLREIASKADVNVAMVAYYFGDKEGLYLTCISEFMSDRLDILKEILTEPSSRGEFELKFRLFLQTVFSTLSTESDMIRIIMREVQTKRTQCAFSDQIFQAMFPLFMLIRSFMQAALDRKILSPSLKAEFLSMQLMGMMTHPFLCESMMERGLGFTMKDKEKQKAYIDHLLEMFLQGVYSEKKS